MREVFPLDDKQLDKLFDNNAADFESALKKAAQDLYKGRETAFTPEIMRRVEADIYLQVLDNLWMQHLENMDHLREGIGWMSVGQRDPLVEYRRRGQIIRPRILERTFWCLSNGRTHGRYDHCFFHIFYFQLFKMSWSSIAMQ